MNSQEWQEQIDDTAAAIRVKESRLAAITHEKARAISDHKRLMLLEREELALPSDIETLRKRLPLLDQALEGALRDEAEGRLRELQLQGAEAAAVVSASSQAIRAAMRELLARITQAQADSYAHGVLVAEAKYLRARFGLTPLRLPAEDRVLGDERAHFARAYEKLFRQPPTTQWDRMRADFQEAERRTAEQRRRDESAALPQIPQFIDYRDTPGRSSTPVADESATLPATHYSYVHYTDDLQRGH